MIWPKVVRKKNKKAKNKADVVIIINDAVGLRKNNVINSALQNSVTF